MTYENFERLVGIRLREAKALLAAGHWHGAYHLAGYVVECQLKSLIAKQTKAGEFPDKKRTDNSVTHDLDRLLNQSQLTDKLKNAIKNDKAFAQRWATFKEWSAESRYNDDITEQMAKELLASIEDPNTGVLQWLQQP